LILFKCEGGAMSTCRRYRNALQQQGNGILLSTSSQVGDNLLWIRSYLNTFWTSLSNNHCSSKWNSTVPRDRIHHLRGDVGIVNLCTYSNALVTSHRLDRLLVFDNTGLVSEELLVQMQETVISLIIEAGVLFGRAEQINASQCAYQGIVCQQMPTTPTTKRAHAQGNSASHIQANDDDDDDDDDDGDVCVVNTVSLPNCPSCRSPRQQLSKNRYYMHGINPTLLSDNTIRPRLNIIAISAQYPMDECTAAKSSRAGKKRKRDYEASEYGRCHSADTQSRIACRREKAPRFDVQYAEHGHSLLLTQRRKR
jgi:hypothetical protein